MFDGTLLFGTKLDASGLKNGLSSVGKMAGKSLAAVTAGISAAGGASIVAGSQFETSFSKASTLFGNTAVDTDNLNSKILAMSSSSGVAATELNETLYQAMSAGVPVTADMSEALGMVETATKLAKGGFTDSATAVDVMTTAINAYGLSAEDASQISDYLITTQNLGKTTVNELAASIGKVIPVASAYGVKMDDLSTNMAVMTKNGIATAEATTYTKAMLNELGDSGSQVSAVLKSQTGMSFAELEASGYSLGDVMSILGDSVDGDSGAFNELWSSSEAGIGALSLLSTGSDEYNSMLAQMQESAGATESAYATMADTFENKSEQAKEGVKNLGIQIYDGLAEDAGGMVDIANEYIQTLSDSFSSGGTEGLVSALGDILWDLVARAAEFAPTLVELAISLIGSLGQSLIDNAPLIFESVHEIINTVLDRIGELLPGISPLTEALEFIIENIDTIALVLAPLIALWAAYQVICGTVSVAQAIMNAVMAANPIMLIIMLIALIIGALIALWNKCEGFRNAVKAIMDAVAGFFTGAWDVIKGAWSVVCDFFAGIWDGIKGAFSAVGSFFGDIFSKAWDNVKKAFGAVKEFFTGIWDTIVGLFTGIGESIGSAVGDAFKGAVNCVLSTIENVINGFIGMINGVIGFINKILGVELGEIKELSLPRLARGGVLKKGQVGFLEGDGDEAVIPLSQNKEWIGNVAKELRGYGMEQTGNAYNNRQTVNIYQPVKSPSEMARAIRMEQQYGLAGV